MKLLYVGFMYAVVFALGCERPAEKSSPEGTVSVPEAQAVEIIRFRPPWPMLEPHPTDPSLKSKMLDGQFVSQFRMIADFDGNGMLDIGFPDSLFEADSFFSIYLRTSDGYKNAGIWDIDAGNPTSIEYVTPPNFSRLWTSGHISSRESLIDYTELKNGMIVTNSTFPNCFEITWDGGEDGGGTKLINALDNAIFRNSSTPVWWEKSVFTNGVFQWIPWRADHL